MPPSPYLHRVEYHRIVGERPVHEYTELADDHGFLFRRRGMTREEALARYTRDCAGEFLDRAGAAPGRWVISVFREQPEGRARVCTVTVERGGGSGSRRGGR